VSRQGEFHVVPAPQEDIWMMVLCLCRVCDFVDELNRLPEIGELVIFFYAVVD